MTEDGRDSNFVTKTLIISSQGAMCFALWFVLGLVFT